MKCCQGHRSCPHLGRGLLQDAHVQLPIFLVTTIQSLNLRAYLVTTMLESPVQALNRLIMRKRNLAPQTHRHLLSFMGL